MRAFESVRLIAIAKLLISVLFLYCAATFIPTFVDDIRIDQGESNDQLKFRVIANSSTNADQLIKYEVVETIQMMAATSQETAAACEEVSASSDEQLRSIQSVAEASETLTELSDHLANVVNKFKV